MTPIFTSFLAGLMALSTLWAVPAMAAGSSDGSSAAAPGVTRGAFRLRGGVTVPVTRAQMRRSSAVRSGGGRRAKRQPSSSRSGSGGPGS
jgi:hypothetical protein